MNKRQAKKIRRKVKIPFADEMNLLALNKEEYEQAMKDFNNYVQKHCKYYHYRDKYKSVPIYHFPVGSATIKQAEKLLTTCRKYHSEGD